MAWRISGLTFTSSVTFSTPAHQIDDGEVSFNLTSSATGRDAVLQCGAHSSQISQFFYGDMWYACAASGSSAFAAGALAGALNTTAARFRFDRPAGVVTLNQAWSCQDQLTRWP